MPLPKVSEVRQLDDDALDEAIVAAKRRLFELRFQKATRQLESGFHQFKHERHRLAQLMTVRRERQMTAALPEADGSAEAPVPEVMAAEPDGGPTEEE